VAALGILGGTFNPPHVAHLVCASEARSQLRLDRVVLMVAATPPHKEVAEDPGAQERLTLARLAAVGEEWLGACDLELRRDGPSYTVDTLREIHAKQPGDELTFIVGGDMAWSLPRWRDPEAVLELARLAVAEREEVRRDDLRRHLASLRGHEQIAFIDMPRLDISSSAVRRRVRDGRPIRHLVPDAVAERIEQKRLYT
jgi:nicotinate-nucleotide adenylyltransferase